MCPRCHGLMVSETVWSGEDGGKIRVSHCLLCGFYDDAQMASNRNHMPLVQTLKQSAQYPQPVRLMAALEPVEPALED